MKLFLSYLDPGTGSVFLSFVLASCVGFVSLYWGKLKRLLGFGKATEKPAEKQAQPPADKGV
ncbi:MAG: hypothetical protein IJS32_10150 [Kiritimatiellae bacterium]|nr:hypothetical protein [Kiritimatiellia bacterium]